MALISLRQLLECGVHFGHPTRKWNPKMSTYIYTKRNGIHILDLQQTTKFIDGVHAYVQQLVGEGKSILFVGTKKQAQDAIREEATKCGMPYINYRWPGGLLTNRATITARIAKLKDLRKQKEENYFDLLPKKEAKLLGDELGKLEQTFGGIADLNGLPDALFIVDVKKEVNAVREAKKLHIPIIGILDTNCDPDDVQYKLPGNDDAIRSIRLFCQIIADSVMEAKYGYLPPDSVFIHAAEDEDVDQAMQLGGPRNNQQRQQRQQAQQQAPPAAPAAAEAAPPQAAAQGTTPMDAPAAPAAPAAHAPGVTETPADPDAPADPPVRTTPTIPAPVLAEQPAAEGEAGGGNSDF